MTTEFAQRDYLSLHAIEDVTAEIWVNGSLTDPDNQEITFSIADITDPNADPIIVVEEDPGRLATRISVGKYSITIDTTVSYKPGLYSIAWIYLLDGVSRVENTYVQIGTNSPKYDALPEEFQVVVDNVWDRFGDLFDSPYGGPNLQTYFQSRFSRERVATLMEFSLGRLNTVAQPFQTYSIDGPKVFPVETWGALLEQATYVEVIKHLMRSYTEQPEVVGSTVARLDRRDYQERWRTLLQAEQPDLEAMLDNFKMAHMGLSKVHVLVAGGAYGRVGPSRFASGRPRFVSRFVY